MGRVGSTDPVSLFPLLPAHTDAQLTQVHNPSSSLYLLSLSVDPFSVSLDSPSGDYRLGSSPANTTTTSALIRSPSPSHSTRRSICLPLVLAHDGSGSTLVPPPPRNHLRRYSAWPPTLALTSALGAHTQTRAIAAVSGAAPPVTEPEPPPLKTVVFRTYICHSYHIVSPLIQSLGSTTKSW